MKTAQQTTKTVMDVDFHAPRQKRYDCIRIAFEYLDAQIKTKSPLKKRINWNNLIVDWGGRAISQAEIEIAADLHPGIKGKYPYYNLRSELTFPSAERLRGISEAFRHSYAEQYIAENYRYFETVQYSSNEANKVVKSFLRKELPKTAPDGRDFCAENDNCQCYYCVYGR